ncbi:MAG: 4-(cytidine 5'-diphospho)-2-C-methyl-D-erythritol kinase, partial [Elusimicrobiota bacterium]|nr:4-(cytidine 5'-diphospho)-2-C-methyl-D-erythritol kinase [Elusimicrobiota bacterium]
QQVTLQGRPSFCSRPIRCKSGIEFECIPEVTNSVDENIAFRAAVLLKEYLSEVQGARIKLIKKIPVASGLGGGSSDAACVLKALPKLWHHKIEKKTLHELAAKLGADVPYFLTGGCCIAEGIGEKITPVDTSWEKNPLWVVLINPGFSLSTKDVYRWWRKSRYTNYSSISEDVGKKATKLSLKEIEFRNDLEQVVFRHYPELKKLKSELLLSGAIASLMSGSGPTIFGIFKKKFQAEFAIEKFNKLKKDNYNIWLVKTV